MSAPVALELLARVATAAEKLGPKGKQVAARLDQIGLAVEGLSLTGAKLGDRAAHLLKEIANGRNRIFAFDAKPPGFGELERKGLAVKSGGDRAELTAAGRAEAVARGFV